MKRDEKEEKDFDGLLVLGGLVAVAAVSVLCWCIAAAATLLGSASLPHLSVIRSAAAAVRVVSEGAWGAPRQAYPAAVAARMPSADLWWLGCTLVVGVFGATTTLAVHRFEPQVARVRLARRPGDLRGSRPRQWARPRDFRDSSPHGFLVGELDRRTIRTPDEAHVALIAPTRAGKTTRCVIPWLLEHDGPAIVTSTKRDILEATREQRQRGGRVWIFDPFGHESCSWDALHGCKDWTGALRQAQWLADATQQGDSEIAGYWRGESAKLLAPLLHAAAIEEATMATVLEWVDRQDPKDAALTLLAEGADAAERQLQAVRSLDARNQGTTFMSAGSVLAAYRYPAVLERSSEADLSPANLLDGGSHTLYVVASERHQRLLEPVLVALLSSMLHGAMERTGNDGRLRVLLDEAANIAPLRDLPRLLSQAAGHGIRIATVWQSLGQMEDRYRLGMHTILANSAAKIVMGSTTDDATRRYLSGLLNEEHDDARRGLSQLETGRAVYISGTGLPALVTTSPHWDRRDH